MHERQCQAESVAPKHKTATAAPTPAPVTPTTGSGTSSDPMDLSATRRHIIPEAKARRMTEGHCYRRGGLGRMARDCPLGQRTLQAAVIAHAVIAPAVAPSAAVVTPNAKQSAN